jgi:hypothetical protein
MKTLANKALLIFTPIALLLAGCASRDTRLEGRWKSNKALTAATIDTWKPRSGPLTPRKRAAFASLFGKLILTYHRGTVTLEMPALNGQPAYRNSFSYRIVASDDDSLAYISANPLTQKREISHVYFDGPNRYWIYLHRTSMKEYFDRIAP